MILDDSWPPSSDYVLLFPPRSRRCIQVAALNDQHVKADDIADTCSSIAYDPRHDGICGHWPPFHHACVTNGALHPLLLDARPLLINK